MRIAVCGFRMSLGHPAATLTGEAISASAVGIAANECRRQVRFHVEPCLLAAFGSGTLLFLLILEPWSGNLDRWTGTATADESGPPVPDCMTLCCACFWLVSCVSPSSSSSLLVQACMEPSLGITSVSVFARSGTGLLLVIDLEPGPTGPSVRREWVCHALERGAGIYRCFSRGSLSNRRSS